GLRTSVRWSPRTHSVSWNGPSPTGCARDAGCLRTSLPQKTCAGRIAAFCSHASENRKGANGFDCRIGIGCLDVLDRLAWRHELRTVLTAALTKPILDILGCQRLAVAPGGGHEMERVGEAVGGNLPALGQRRHDAEALGEAHQPVVEHAACQNVR